MINMKYSVIQIYINYKLVSKNLKHTVVHLNQLHIYQVVTAKTPNNTCTSTSLCNKIPYKYNILCNYFN